MPSLNIERMRRLNPEAKRFQLVALEGLSCGCVAGAYKAVPWDVGLVALEAKGPYCIFSDHASGAILRLGELSEFVDDEAEDER